MTLKFRPIYGACLIAFAATGCFEGHALPGTREGLTIDGGSDGAIDESDAGSDAEVPDAGPPPPPPCDVTLCQGATSFFGDTPACCTVDEQCGLDFSALGLAECLQREAPGQITAACPAVDLFGFVSFPGCCAPEGLCGLNVNAFLPLGCVVEGIPIPGVPAEPPTACTPVTPD
jgi:hypothetical protein